MRKIKLHLRKKHLEKSLDRIYLCGLLSNILEITNRLPEKYQYDHYVDTRRYYEVETWNKKMIEKIVDKGFDCFNNEIIGNTIGLTAGTYNGERACLNLSFSNVKITTIDVIDLSFYDDEMSEDDLKTIYQCFNEIIDLFKPYHASIETKDRTYSGYKKGGVRRIEETNYFDDNTEKELGLLKLKTISLRFPKTSYKDHILMLDKNNPFAQVDDDYVKEVEKYLLSK